MSKRDDALAKINTYLVANGTHSITAAQLNEICAFLANYYSTTEELAMSLLTDVDLTGITTNDVLKWNGTKFVKWTVPNIPVNLDDISDVVIGTPLHRQFLEYDGPSGKYVNKDLSTINNISVNTIINVNHADTLVLNANSLALTFPVFNPGRSYTIITNSTTDASHKVQLIAGSGVTINGGASYDIITPNTAVIMRQISSNGYVVINKYQMF